MKPKLFTFKLEHDNGSFYQTVHTTTAKKAKQSIIDVELCPFNAIVAQVVPIENVKKGDFVRIKGTKRVYTKQAFDRYQKKYELHAENDISEYRYIKKGRLVEIDFDY